MKIVKIVNNLGLFKFISTTETYNIGDNIHGYVVAEIIEVAGRSNNIGGKNNLTKALHESVNLIDINTQRLLTELSTPFKSAINHAMKATLNHFGIDKRFVGVNYSIRASWRTYTRSRFLQGSGTISKLINNLGDDVIMTFEEKNMEGIPSVENLIEIWNPLNITIPDGFVDMFYRELKSHKDYPKLIYALRINEYGFNFNKLNFDKEIMFNTYERDYIPSLLINVYGTVLQTYVPRLPNSFSILRNYQVILTFVQNKLYGIVGDFTKREPEISGLNLFNETYHVLNEQELINILSSASIRSSRTQNIFVGGVADFRRALNNTVINHGAANAIVMDDINVRFTDDKTSQKLFTIFYTSDNMDNTERLVLAFLDSIGKTFNSKANLKVYDFADEYGSHNKAFLQYSQILLNTLKTISELNPNRKYLYRIIKGYIMKGKMSESLACPILSTLNDISEVALQLIPFKSDNKNQILLGTKSDKSNNPTFSFSSYSSRLRQVAYKLDGYTRETSDGVGYLRKHKIGKPKTDERRSELLKALGVMEVEVGDTYYYTTDTEKCELLKLNSTRERSNLWLNEYSFKRDAVYIEDRNEFIYGIELEFAIPNLNSYSHLDNYRDNLIVTSNDILTDGKFRVYSTSDSSVLSGFETKTIPMNKKTIEGLSWDSYFEFLYKNGADGFHSSCGLHLHMDRGVIEKKLISRLDAKTINTFNSLLNSNSSRVIISNLVADAIYRIWGRDMNSLVSFTRRESSDLNRYARISNLRSHEDPTINCLFNPSIRDPRNREILINKLSNKSFYHGSSDKYTALACHKSQTLEFRLFRGVNNTKDLFDAIDFATVSVEMGIDYLATALTSLVYPERVDDLLSFSDVRTNNIIEKIKGGNK